MSLSEVLLKAKSVGDFNEIFDKSIQVQLGWFEDEVTVNGYRGTVTTDFVAQRILSLSDENTEESRRLAASLMSKVFMPLKNLVEAPENRCSLYQVSALMRMCWVPRPAVVFGTSVALRHAMVVGVLDPRYASW